MTDYRLQIIEKCENLVIECYAITQQILKTEKYSLCSQMNRSAISVGSNIVEGNSRKTSKEFLQFLYIAKGSLAELEFQNNICNRIYNIKISDLSILEVKKMLNGLISYLKSKI